MIIWDENDTFGPCKKWGRCAMCRGRLSFPFVMWYAADHGEDEGLPPRTGPFICGECCADMCRGFSLDMRQIVKAKEVGRMGFHGAARKAAVSGGFLWTNETREQ